MYEYKIYLKYRNNRQNDSLIIVKLVPQQLRRKDRILYLD